MLDRFIVISTMQVAIVAKEFYTVEEMAELLRIRPGTVRNRLLHRSEDVPPSVVIGRRRLFPVSGYEDWKRQRFHVKQALKAAAP
jgi:hypothetical protein